MTLIRGFGGIGTGSGVGQVAAPAGFANRFDVLLSSSAVAPGNAITINIIPNGSYPAATGKSIVLTPSNGDAAITLAVPTSGSATLTGSYTPSTTGEVSLVPTNSAGFFNSYPAPLTVFATSSGTAQTITANLSRNDMMTFQRDTAAGNPSGFSAAWAKGWGEVTLTLGQSGPALFARLTNARSSGASTTVGTGTALTGVVQVHGAFTAGAVRVLLPAGPYDYYLDLATDAAFTSPVRVAQRFRVGVQIAKMGRSQESGLARGYAYSSAQALPTSYTETATWMAFDSRYAITDCGWYLHDAAVTDPYQYHYSEPASSAAQEMGRLMESQLGVRVGIAGLAATGGNLGLDSFVNPDGSFTSAFNDTIAAANGGKFRYFWGASGGWDGVNSSYPTETAAELQRRFGLMAARIAIDHPACAIIGWVAGASGVFGSDGSRATGYTRNQTIWMALEASNRMCVSKESYLWNEFYSGHATMSARVDYVRPGFRKIMAVELAALGGLQTTERGPRLASTGSVAGRVLSIPYTVASGASLTAVSATYSNPNAATYGTPSAAELASLFSVYPAGANQGTSKAIRIDSAAINAGTGKIDLTLTGASGITYADNTTAAMPSGFSVDYAADFGASNSAITPQYAGGPSKGVMLADNRVDTANGIPYGWHMLPALDVAVS